MSTRLYLRMSEELKARLERIAEHKHLELSTYCRQVLSQAAEREDRSTMQRITMDTGDRVEWLIDYEDFETPDGLAHYLRQYAPGGSYRIEGCNIWAHDMAIGAVFMALEEDAQREAEREQILA